MPQGGAGAPRAAPQRSGGMPPMPELRSIWILRRKVVFGGKCTARCNDEPMPRRLRSAINSERMSVICRGAHPNAIEPSKALQAGSPPGSLPRHAVSDSWRWDRRPALSATGDRERKKREPGARVVFTPRPPLGQPRGCLPIPSIRQFGPKAFGNGTDPPGKRSLRRFARRSRSRSTYSRIGWPSPMAEGASICQPVLASIASRRLYFANRSDRVIESILMYVPPQAVARSASQ